MFEDSTFESTGRIRTRSRGWMLATLLLNSSILLVLILIPLVYPEALPHQVLSLLLTAPPPPPAPAPPQEQRPTQAFHGVPQMDEGTLVAPSQIPAKVDYSYFSVSQAGPCWEHMVKTRKLGLYVPGDLPEPEMELLVILEA